MTRQEFQMLWEKDRCKTAGQIICDLVTDDDDNSATVISRRKRGGVIPERHFEDLEDFMYRKGYIAKEHEKESDGLWYSYFERFDTAGIELEIIEEAETDYTFPVSCKRN